MKLKIIAAVIFLALPVAVEARPMITDLSDRIIKINAKFTGKDILLYGARIEAGKIVVVIRGPGQDYIVRKKENINGVWVNTSSVEFKGIPQFYRVASSVPLERLDPQPLVEKLGIGFDTINYNPRPSSRNVKLPEFEKALRNQMMRDRLFDFEVVNLPFLEGTLFRIRIDFPAKITDGIYTAEIYSFEDGQLLGMQSIPIEARKTGVEAFIYDSAHKSPALYGICCILLAVTTGLVSGRLFKKF